MKRSIGVWWAVCLLCATPVQALNLSENEQNAASIPQSLGADFKYVTVPCSKMETHRYKTMQCECADFPAVDADGRMYVYSNFKSTNFNNMYLWNFHGQFCDFTRATFVNAVFPGVLISGSTMQHCDFSGMDTSPMDALTQFRRTSLVGANFQDAVLRKVFFYRCDLTGVHWDHAEFSDQTCFQDCLLDVSARSSLRDAGVRLVNNQWIGSEESPKPAASLSDTFYDPVSYPRKGMVPKGP
ncbi:hypothetical protein GO013_05365 [Pseudodesulfovibrio sp. JC047]|uniref:pentapeptide repeat-containing protein n=1 Tax=Pseudodesulfovibrio sp. JC047 TaxID=2683199 RepID=UPI0013D6CDBB|nr:pentapeptide repeat-containing protein [Pseudodesulfovibrio sp. JC047]NDV18848.1 hypothetical protein [Pseudodesulfovibrio sp. JC047]